MNLIQAVNTKKPFKRQHQLAYFTRVVFGAYQIYMVLDGDDYNLYSFTREDFLADDWEVLEAEKESFSDVSDVIAAARYEAYDPKRPDLPGVPIRREG